jgi:hypothetical protein
VDGGEVLGDLAQEDGATVGITPLPFAPTYPHQDHRHFHIGVAERTATFPPPCA